MLRVIFRVNPKLMNEGVAGLEKHFDELTLKELRDRFSELYKKVNEEYSKETSGSGSGSKRRRLYKDKIEVNYTDFENNKKTASLDVKLIVTKNDTGRIAELVTNFVDRFQEFSNPVLYLYVFKGDLPLKDSEIKYYMSTLMNHELVHLLDDDRAWGAMDKDYWEQSTELTAYTTEILSEIREFLNSEDPKDIEEKEEILKDFKSSKAKGQAYARLFSKSRTFSRFKDLDYEDDQGRYKRRNPQFKSWVSSLYKHLSPIIKKELTDA